VHVHVCVGSELGEISAVVTDPSGVEDRCDIADDDAGVYQVLFKPRETGVHSIAVYRQHSAVPGTSLSLTMLSVKPDVVSWSAWSVVVMNDDDDIVPVHDTVSIQLSPTHLGTLLSSEQCCAASQLGWLAQLAERRSLAGELTLFYARPVADW